MHVHKTVKNCYFIKIIFAKALKLHNNIYYYYNYFNIIQHNRMRLFDTRENRE